MYLSELISRTLIMRSAQLQALSHLHEKPRVMLCNVHYYWPAGRKGILLVDWLATDFFDSDFGEMTSLMHILLAVHCLTGYVIYSNINYCVCSNPRSVCKISAILVHWFRTPHVQTALPFPTVFLPKSLSARSLL